MRLTFTKDVLTGVECCCVSMTIALYGDGFFYIEPHGMWFRKEKTHPRLPVNYCPYCGVKTRIEQLELNR